MAVSIDAQNFNEDVKVPPRKLGQSREAVWKSRDRLTISKLKNVKAGKIRHLNFS
jgi:hypothetical protein